MDEFISRAVADPFIYIVQVCEGFNTIQLAGFHQGIKKGCPFSAVFIIGEQGIFLKSVTAATLDGYEGMDAIHISVYTKADIYVPNVFTPNGDGRNDVFRPIAVGIKNFNYFTIYNRWGQQIFISSSSSAVWDGRLNGEMQLPGTYIWMASGVDYQGNLVQRKGTVILIR